MALTGLTNIQGVLQVVHQTLRTARTINDFSWPVASVRNEDWIRPIVWQSVLVITCRLDGTSGHACAGDRVLKHTGGLILAEGFQSHQDPLRLWSTPVSIEQLLHVEPFRIVRGKRTSTPLCLRMGSGFWCSRSARWFYLGLFACSIRPSRNWSLRPFLYFDSFRFWNYPMQVSWKHFQEMEHLLKPSSKHVVRRFSFWAFGYFPQARVVLNGDYVV